jgi:hypothetical protein
MRAWIGGLIAVPRFRLMVVGVTPPVRSLLSEALLLRMPVGPTLSASAETNFWGKRP